MIFKNISVLGEDFNVYTADVLVKDGKIAKIAKDIKTDDKEIINGSGKLLMSGLYNAHTHMPMSLMRGYGENMELDRWLNEKIFPFEEKLNSQHVYNAVLLQTAEMIRYGTVSVSDMYFFCEDIAKACIQAGIQANISRSIVCFDDSSVYELESFKETESLYKEYHNAENGSIKVDMSIHAEYTSTPKVISELACYAKSQGAGMQIHLSETQKEHEECIQRHQKTPAKLFAECGAFDVPATAAHCVYVTEEDMDILASKGVTIAHNPVSNLKLASGVAPVGKFLEKGINVALGTDSVASNNSANLFEEVKLAAILHKGVTGDPSLVSCRQALEMATVNGAKAQGRDDCGLVKEGYRANLIMIDMTAPNMQPVYEHINNLVYSLSADNIEMTMVNGRILYQNGEYKTIDVEKAIYYANKSKDSILKGLTL